MDERHLTPHWIFCPGKSLWEVEAAAIRSSFARLDGHRACMRKELGISRSSLLRKLDRLGLREKHPRIVRPLRERDLERAFERHRKEIAKELRISESTLLRWLNTKAPFEVEE